METKHTPGPWEYERMLLGASEDRRSGFVVNRQETAPDGWSTRICDMRCSPEKGFAECEANAQLIAAAPELLAALIGMREWARRVKGPNPGMEVYAAICAIEKATVKGESDVPIPR
jgi:hypothetical protein